MTITYYVHGTSTDNELKVSSGWSDSLLSDLGERQTRDAAANLWNHSFDLIICSDLIRAKQSAAILFPDIHTVYDARLRECNYGIYNGTPHKNVVYQDHIYVPFPEGESLIDVQARMKRLIDEIKLNYISKNIALVGHRATQLALEVMSKNISWEEAIASDWRTVGKWKLGWEYDV